MDIQPLTRRNSDGEIYKRLPIVIHQIERAIKLEPNTLLEQARVSDSKSIDYLQEESLVYLIRHFHRQKQSQVVGHLSEVLISRIAWPVKQGLRALGPDNADEAYSEVIYKIFERILNIESDIGDFLQVRFWRALKAQIITTYNYFAKQQVRDQELEFSTVSLAADEELTPILSRTDNPWETIIDRELLPDEQVIIVAGVNSLKEPYRTAYILRSFMQLKLESLDPSELTLSTYFGKPSRTIRNWLNKAEEQLEKWWTTL